MQTVRGVFFITLIAITSIACNLAYVGNGDNRSRSELTPTDTSTWVAYPGRGVRMGAPPNSWELIPIREESARQRYSELQAVDPTVANVYLDLSILAPNDLYRLILMKRDGTAWLKITSTSILPNEGFEDVIERQRAALIDVNKTPFNERTVSLPIGDAVRWTIDVSPPNSQIINREFQYLVVVSGQLYTLTFSAQLPDFAEYAPLFETMALSFGIEQ